MSQKTVYKKKKLIRFVHLWVCLWVSYYIIVQLYRRKFYDDCIIKVFFLFFPFFLLFFSFPFNIIGIEFEVNELHNSLPYMLCKFRIIRSIFYTFITISKEYFLFSSLHYLYIINTEYIIISWHFLKECL